MKKWFAFMEWGIFALRAYHYLLLAISLSGSAEPSFSFVFEIIWLMAAFAVPIVFWFPQRRSQNLLFIMTELLLGGSYYIYSVAHPILTANVDYLLPSLTIGYMLTRRIFWMLPVILAVPLIAKPFQNISWEHALGQSMDNLLFAFIGIWVSYIATAYREKNLLMQAVEEQNRQLTRYAEQVQQMTRLEERHRLSGELHDTLGHSYISLIMGIDVSLALLDRDPAQARERLQSLRTLAEEHLEEMRSFVHRIGEDEDDDLEEQVSQLLNDFQAYTGTVVHFHLFGTILGLSFDQRQIVIQMVQESLTNAVKHGKASEIEVELRLDDANLHIRIRNNGIPFGQATYGFGLTSMEQRLQALGGLLDIESDDSGTLIYGIIPQKGVDPS